MCGCSAHGISCNWKSIRPSHFNVWFICPVLKFSYLLFFPSLLSYAFLFSLMLLSGKRTSSVLPFLQLMYQFHPLLYIWVLMPLCMCLMFPSFFSLVFFIHWLVLLCILVMGSLQKSLQLFWLCQFKGCLSGDKYFLHVGTFWIQLCSMLLPVITSFCSALCQTFLSSSLIKAVWRGSLGGLCRWSKCK